MPVLLPLFLLGLGAAIATGAAPGPLLLAVLALGLTQVLPGAMIWRCIRARRGWWLEDVIAGFAIGTGITVATQVIAGSTGLRALSWVLPLSVVAVLALLPPTRARIVGAQCQREPWPLWPALAASVLISLPDTAFPLLKVPVDWTDQGPHLPSDALFQVGLSGELLHHGPAAWPFFSGESLSYPWFTHAWTAHLSSASGLELDQVLYRLLPVLTPLLVAGGVAAVALRWTGRAGVAAAAPVLLAIGGRANVFGRLDPSGPTNWVSPTLNLSVPLLLILVALLVMRWRGEAGRGAAVVVFALALVATGTKGSTTPLLIAGAALAALAMAFGQRERMRVVLVDLALMLVAMVVTMKVVIGGSQNGLRLDPGQAVRSGPLGQLLGAVSGWQAVTLLGVTLVLAGLSRVGLAAVLLSRPDRQLGRADPITWLLIGAVIAGIGAVLLFVQPGASQFYFMISSYPLAAVASAAGLDVLWTRSRAALAGMPVRQVLLRWVSITAVVLVAAIAVFVLPAAPFPGRDLERRTATITLVLVVGVLLWGLTAAGVVAWARQTLGARGRITVVRLLSAACAIWVAVGIVAGMSSFRMVTSGPPPQLPTAAERLHEEGYVDAGRVEAARYLRDHSSPDQLFATNRHCLDYDDSPEGLAPCDARWFVGTAYSERRALVEGWGYAPRIVAEHPHGRSSLEAPFDRPETLRRNDRFFLRPDAADARWLWDRGVRWLYRDEDLGPRVDLSSYATLELRTPTATVWRLRSPEVR
ncbi:hypothetical protein ACMYYO_02230 [Dermacoccaceae bacterium W4C1]